MNLLSFATAALALYVVAGCLVFLFVRRKRPSLRAIFAIGIGGAIGAFATALCLLPFGKLEADLAVIGYFLALGLGAILGSVLALRFTGRTA